MVSVFHGNDCYTTARKVCSNSLAELIAWPTEHGFATKNCKHCDTDRFPFPTIDPQAVRVPEEVPAVSQVVAGFLPDPAERRVVLKQLVASADHAQSVAPDAWGVTLYRDLFRLNVERVEVLVVGQGFVRLNCVGERGMPPFVGPHFERPDPEYKSVPDPYCAYLGPIDVFATLQAELQQPHREFIDVVGRTRSGEPVKGSPNTRSHSEGLMAYARSVMELSAGPFVLPDEVSGGGPLAEGAICQVTVNAYERNPDVRARCIAAHGTSCCICGFSFAAVYGPEAEGYIHVHHLLPLSEFNGGHVVDPVKDLRPVCPNCHAVLHLGGECRSIEEVTRMVEDNRA